MKNLFVSSTFIDMQQERDALRYITAPQVNAEAAKYGDHIDFYDLRWGIDTSHMSEQESSNRVLDMCLDEIDDSDAPMILLLGDRYGWMPGEDKIREQTAKKHMVLDDYNISVTEMEMLFGTKHRELPFFVYEKKFISEDFRVKPNEDDLHAKKLAVLKKKLRSMPNCVYREYEIHLHRSSDGRITYSHDDIKEFAQLVATDLKQYFNKQWNKVSNSLPVDQKLNIFWNYINETAPHFEARKNCAKDVLDLVNAEDKPHAILIRGQSGSGKSTLFSYLAKELEKNLFYEVVPFIIGLSSDSLTFEDINIYLRDFFAHRQVIRPGKTSIVMIDACNLLDANEWENLKNNIKMQKGLRYIITGTPEIVLNQENTRSYYIGELDIDDRSAVLSAISKTRKKELPKEVVEYIKNLPGSYTPLDISLMIDRLFLLSQEDFEKINSSSVGQNIIGKQAVNTGDVMAQYMVDLLKKCPAQTEELAKYVFNQAANLINKNLINEVINLIASSEFGLTVEELALFCNDNWNMPDFLRFTNYFNEYFMQREDGRFDFSHKTIRMAIEQSMDKKAIYSKTANVLLSLNINHPMRQKELIYHLAAAGMKSEILQYFTVLYKNQDKFNDINLAFKNAKNSIYRSCLNGYDSFWLNLMNDFSNHTDALYIFWFWVHNVDNAFKQNDHEMKMRLTFCEAIVESVDRFKNQYTEDNYKTIMEGILKGAVFASDFLRDKEHGRKYAAKLIDIQMPLTKFHEAKTAEDLIEPFNEYYNYLAFMKDKCSAVVLEEIIRRTEKEIYPFLTDETRCYLAENKCPVGEFYGCIGEMYGHLNNYEKLLENYLIDYQWRNYYYQTGKNSLILENSGSYYNVGYGLFRNNRYDEVWDYWKEWRRLEDAQRDDLSSDYQLRQIAYTFSGNLFVWYYSEDNTVHLPEISSLLPEYAIRYLNAVIRDMRNTSNPGIETILQQWCLFLGNEIKIRTIRMPFNIGNDQLSYDNEIAESKLTDEFKNEIRALRMEEQNLLKEEKDSKDDLRRRLNQCNKILKEFEHEYGTYMDIMLEENITTVSEYRKRVCSSSVEQEIAPYLNVENLKSKEEISTKQVNKLLKKYEFDFQEKDIIALYDASIFHNVLKGILFTSNGIYLPKHEKIEYSSLQYVYLDGKNISITLRFTDESQEEFIISGDKNLYKLLRTICVWAKEQKKELGSRLKISFSKSR